MDKDEKKILGVSRNVISMSVVSFLNDLSSEMVFPFIPIFLTTVLGASVTFVSLVEGFADATASILKIFSGMISDKLGKRKQIVVFGYSLSALAKPMLSFATAPWHVFVVRFLDRSGKGIREAPRDALISSSTEKRGLGKAFGFNKSADRMGGIAGPLVAFALLPFLNGDLRTLFLLSFVASFFAVLVLMFFVKEIVPKRNEDDDKIKFEFKHLGTSFKVFLIATTLFTLGAAPDAILLLRAREVGVSLVYIPILYLIYNLVFSVFSVPAGALSDKIGHRNTYMIGMLIFSATYVIFANTTSSFYIWFVFAVYGLYSAFTDGVGRAIVADLVDERWRATAYGIYNAVTGLAILPGSLLFGLLWDVYGAHVSFYCGSALGLASFIIFAFLRVREHHVLV